MSPIHCLLVEDEIAHAELVRRSFERAGNTVSAVANLEDANAALSDPSRAIDVVVTDLRLPDGLGTSLIADDPETEGSPVVIMTAQGDERAAVEAMRLGAYDYVVKSPQSFREMSHTATRVMRQWQLEQEKKALREALLERQRLAGIGTAAAMLAHEIGNPLHSMAIAAQLIERRAEKLDGGEDLAEIVAICRSEIERLTALLTEFRGLSRQQDLRCSSVDVVDLVDDLLRAQRPVMEARRVTIVSTSGPGVRAVFADKAKLSQVLLNLCKNATEALVEGGHIEVKTSVDGDELLIAVRDNGPGLPEGFDPLAPFTTTKAEGTGLGLAVVAQILAAHGGSIALESAPNAGTCATVRLPLAPRAARD